MQLPVTDLCFVLYRMDSATVRVVFIALLLDILAFTIILPLFPRLLDYYRLQEAGNEVRLERFSRMEMFTPLVGRLAFFCVFKEYSTGTSSCYSSPLQVFHFKQRGHARQMGPCPYGRNGRLNVLLFTIFCITIHRKFE